MSTTSFAHLQLGTGDVGTIHVIVPLGDGRFELATERCSPTTPNETPRLTDEEWRVRLNDRELPPRPQWVESFVVGAEVAAEPRVTFEP